MVGSSTLVERVLLLLAFRAATRHAVELVEEAAGTGGLVLVLLLPLELLLSLVLVVLAGGLVCKLVDEIHCGGGGWALEVSRRR